jgi:hypothetical protein
MHGSDVLGYFFSFESLLLLTFAAGFTGFY